MVYRFLVPLRRKERVIQKNDFQHPAHCLFAVA